MYSKNNSGPSTDPCGTPCLISLQEDLYLFIISLFKSLWFIEGNKFIILLSTAAVTETSTDTKRASSGNLVCGVFKVKYIERLFLTLTHERNENQNKLELKWSKYSYWYSLIVMQ